MREPGSAPVLDSGLSVRPAFVRSPLASRFVTGALYLFFYAAAGLALLIGGGLVLQVATGDLYIPRVPLRLTAAALSLAASAACGMALWRLQGRNFVFATVAVGLSSLIAVYGFDWAAGRFTPPWPHRALHAAPPEEFYRVINHAKPDDFNSWGQKDRERTLAPAAGVHRVAFVGDSFLEASREPVSLMVERQIGRDDVEIVNLGVQGTAPDEYFFRVKNVALPLGVRHVYLFFYPGNDLLQGPTLRTFWGVAAVEPRDSLLGFLGLSNINHLIMNRHRHFTGEETRIDVKEAGIREEVQALEEQDVTEYLLSFVKPSYRERLRERLGEAARPIVDMLRSPDEGVFRSFSVEAMLRFAAGQDLRRARIPARLAYRWLNKTAALCREEGVGLTVVFVPLAPEADGRLREVFAPLGDVVRMTQSRIAARDRLMARLEKNGVDMVNLLDPLRRTPRSYLNLDWHWSDAGARAAAEAMSEAVAYRLPN